MASRVVFAGGTIFDSVAGSFGRADLVAEGDRIIDVGLDCDGDEVIDVTGKSLLPGFVDCHLHVLLPHVDRWRLAQTPFSYRFFQAAHILAVTLAGGVTSARDAGGADLGIKRALADGLIQGPNLSISIRMLSQTGGHGDDWLPSGTVVPLFPIYPGAPEMIVDGPIEMRRTVRELIRGGAEVIKVAVSGGTLSPTDEASARQFDDAELDALFATAQAAGIPVMAHSQSIEGTKAAVRAGVRSIEHGVRLDDEAVELMLDNGVFLVPTLLAPIAVREAALAGELAIPDASFAKLQEAVEVQGDAFRLALAAGVKIAMGSDSPVVPHGENLRELQAMAEHGMRPEDVLRSATRLGAELLGMADEIGALEPGKRCDLVVVEGDPLELVDLWERITDVYKDGRPTARAKEIPLIALDT